MKLEGKWTVELDALEGPLFAGCTSVAVDGWGAHLVTFTDAQGRVHIFSGDFHLISEDK